MAALAIAYRGSNVAVITNVCMEATSVVGIAHSLPTTPDIGAITRIAAVGTNSSFGTGVSLTYDANTITFTNLAGQALVVDAWVRTLHSITR